MGQAYTGGQSHPTMECGITPRNMRSASPQCCHFLGFHRLPALSPNDGPRSMSSAHCEGSLVSRSQTGMGADAVPQVATEKCEAHRCCWKEVDSRVAVSGATSRPQAR